MAIAYLKIFDAPPIEIDGSVSLIANVGAGGQHIGSLVAHHNGWNIPLFVRTIVVHTIAIAALVLSCPGVSFGQIRPYAFVPNLADDIVNVLNASDHTTVGAAMVDSEPRSVAVTPDGRLAYVVDVDPIFTTRLKAIDVISGGVPVDIAIGVDPRQGRRVASAFVPAANATPLRSE
jgi:hypothetical protein